MIRPPKTDLLIRTRNFLNSTGLGEARSLAAEINEAFPEINEPATPTPKPSTEEMQAFGKDKDHVAGSWGEGDMPWADEDN